MIISFSGTSGAGKSTIIKQLLESNYLKKKEVLVVEEDSFFIPAIFKKIIGIKSFKGFNRQKLFERKPVRQEERVFEFLVIIFYPFIISSELYVRCLFYRMLHKNKLIIYNRFSYDYYVTYKHNFKSKYKFLQKILLLIPRPDIPFYLSINLKTAMKRNKNNIKGSITIKDKFHKYVIQEYNDISRNKKLIAIDSSRNVSIVKNEVINYIKRRDFLNNIKQIAICGPDGTGKSTIAKMFSDYASVIGIKVSVVHFFHDNILFKVAKKIGIIKGESQKRQIERNYRKSIERRRKLEKPFVWAFFHFADSLIQYYYYKVLFWNRIIVYDRYFYDFIVSFRYHKVKNVDFFNKFIPRIINVFVLEDLPRTIFLRKPENVIEFFVESNQLYDGLSIKFNLEKIITTGKKPEIVFAELISKLGI